MEDDTVEWKDFVASQLIEEYDTIFSRLEEEENKVLSLERKSQYFDILRRSISSLWDECVHDAYRVFVDTIRDPVCALDLMTIMFLSPFLPVKVIFVDARIHDVVVLSDAYQKAMTQSFEDEMFVFLLFFPESHTFECLGKVETVVDDNDNKMATIQRSFTYTDPLVQKATARLCQ
jgi:hypothetical protein